MLLIFLLLIFSVLGFFFSFVLRLCGCLPFLLVWICVFFFCVFFFVLFCFCVVLCCVVLCGVVWCGVVWCGVVWCGVVWCGVFGCVFVYGVGLRLGKIVQGNLLKSCWMVFSLT